MHPARRAYVEEIQDEDEDMGITIDQVPTDHDYVIGGGTSGIAPEKASAIIQQIDKKKRAAAITVPTDDGRVRAKLREMGEPITLFGEEKSDRRDRLRALLAAQLDEAGRKEVRDGEDISMADADEEAGDDEDVEEEFFTEGIPELLTARQWIAQFSIERARDRRQLQMGESTVTLPQHSKHRKGIKDRLAGYNLLGSQLAGDRPVSITRFSNDSKVIAAGNWDGGIRILSVPNMNIVKTLRGHTDKVGGLSWSPMEGLSEDAPCLVSGGGEGDIHLWNMKQDTPVASLLGHGARVCRVEYHPSGRYVGSASYDTTWRLWDVETTTELLLQEGHSREVFAISFQCDGALVATAGLDAIGRVWDLRTGRTVQILDGHIREIHGLAFSPNGYQVVSASADATVKVWDVRKMKCISTIGAHTGLVSDIRFFEGGVSTGRRLEDGDIEMGDRGKYFVTGGFDKVVNVFSSDDWALVKNLQGHSGNVLSVDVAKNGNFIVSSGHDRTCKLWARDDVEL
ncbi:Beta-TrCP [Orbilia brochopaga]|nr:Beta-TrCP [Drechslerella brochopaga]